MPNVLLIEDSPDIRALVRLLLEQAGHPVAEGADGEEGLRLARAGGFDLILTDLAMPGLSGWDLVGTRKADPRTAQTPIVALTAHAMRGDRERALALGCDGFIAKPIDDESYARTVAKFLSAAASPPRRRRAPRRPRSRPRRRPRGVGCWWSTTTRGCGRWSGTCCRPRASGAARRSTGPGRWRRSGPSRRSWSCWT